MSLEVNINGITVNKEIVDHIPVIYMEPTSPVKERKLAIFLSGLSETKESLVYYLKDIADRGYIALAFDNYQHGERGIETQGEIGARVFKNMRRHGWVILGQTVLDTLRVIDWAIDKLQVLPLIHMGGISMGGDISIAVAGIDPRIIRVAPLITTPDWMRPGMHNIPNTNGLLDPGMPDSYAQFFYNQFDPYTHIERYINCPPMLFTLGEEDDHIPPENAERFKRELAKLSPEAVKRIEIVYIPAPNANHIDVLQRKNDWWPSMLNWWLGHK